MLGFTFGPDQAWNGTEKITNTLFLQIKEHPVVLFVLYKQKSGIHQICIETDLPTTVPKVTNQNASFTTYVENGYGEEYIRKNFPGIFCEVREI